MNRKNAGFIATIGSLLAIGIGTAVLDEAQIESKNSSNMVAVVGIVDLENAADTKTAVGSIFCLHLDCVEQQSKMFSRKLSGDGNEPTTHFASGWYWGEQQYQVFLQAYNAQSEFEFKFSKDKTFEEMMAEESLMPIQDPF